MGKQGDKAINRSAFEAYLKNNIHGNMIKGCCAMGNTIVFDFEKHCLEIDPSWRIVVNRKVYLGSADIGGDEEFRDEEDKKSISDWKAIHGELFGALIDGIFMEENNDLRIIIGGVEIQSFNSGTHSYGNIVVRDTERNTTIHVGPNFIYERQVKKFPYIKKAENGCEPST